MHKMNTTEANEVFEKKKRTQPGLPIFGNNFENWFETVGLSVQDKQNADMFRVCAGDRYISKKLLRLALFLFYISSVNCYFNLLASKAILERSATESTLSHGNITTRSWHSESDNLFKSAAKGAESAEQARVFFGGKGIFAVGRRLRLALLPIMYKLGVISTMLVGITVMVLKGLTIGVILLFFALGNALAKFKTPHIPQPVHFHLHPGDIHHKAPIYQSYGPSDTWDKSADVDVTAHYENYDPSAIHRRIQAYRHQNPYPYGPSHGYYGYYGR